MRIIDIDRAKAWLKGVTDLSRYVNPPTRKQLDSLLPGWSTLSDYTAGLQALRESARSDLSQAFHKKYPWDDSLDHRSGFAFRSSVGLQVGVCQIESCHERATHVLWSWSGADRVEACSKHKAGSIQFYVSTNSHRSQIKGTRIIEDGETFDDLREAIREATIAAFERIESNSRYAYHELTESCPWLHKVNFKNKTFTQGFAEARADRNRIRGLQQLARDMVDADYKEITFPAKRFKHLTLPRSL